MVQYEIKVEGRVQGVGFRYFVQKRATEWHIAGWVKNTVDGGVLVMAQGRTEDMDVFLDHLRRGPSMARVDRVIEVPVQGLGHFDDFRIKY